MSTPSAPAEQAAHFVALLKRFRTAMLVTHVAQGLHARPMAIAEIEDDGRLWFFTADGTAKVHEIEADSHVHLIAQDGDSAFFSLSGRATLIGDREKIAHLWKEPFRVWFPQGKDDPSIELISVRPSEGEFWDVSGANRCKYLWDAAKAYLTGTTPPEREGELHGKIRL